MKTHQRDQLTQEKLKGVLRYEPDTGNFYNVVSRGSRAQAGTLAGACHGEGYRSIRIGGPIYLAHRLAFLDMTGEWPVAEVDHINGDRSDTRWVNLRLADRRTNSENKRTSHAGNTSGFLGVYYNKARSKYMAQLGHNGNNTYLGSFNTAEEAHAAYLKAKRELHEGCTI